MRASAIFRRFLVGLLVLSTAAIVRAQTAPVVGQLGDLSRLEVHGLKAVSLADLRQALLSDGEFQIASTPTAPLDDFLRVTRAQLQLGFLRSGFPEAKVEVAADSARQSLQVTVNEGPRLNAGDIEITNAGAIDVARLSDYLLKGAEAGRFPLKLVDRGAQVKSEGDPDKPRTSLWKPGEPAPLDQVAIDRLEKDVRSALALQGFFASRFSVATQRHDNTARLVNHIEDAGPRAVLAEIEINGATRNTRDEILSYLKLSPGMTLDSRKLQALQGALWDSARFWQHALTMTRLDNDPQRVKLKIDLVEHDTAPTLGHELLPEQTALLRCAAWFQESINAGSDLVFEATDHAVIDAKVIMNPSHGAVARLRSAANPTLPQTRPSEDFAARFARIDTAVVISSRQLGFYELGNHDRVVCNAGGTPFQLQLRLTYLPTEGKKESYFTIAAGAESQPDTDGGIKLQTRIAPVSILDRFRDDPQHKMNVNIKDGVFTLTTAGVTFRCDAATGKFIEAIIEGQGDTYRITIDPGALQREIDALGRALPAAPSANNTPTRASEVLIAALSSFLRARSNSGTPQTRLAGSRALRKLLGRASVILADNLASPDSDFDIPDDPRKFLQGGGNPMALLFLAVPWTDRLSTRGSWPWTLTRETLLVLSGSAKYTHLEARRMMNSPDVGPVGFLAIARAYAAADDPVTARIFAKRGLERLDLNFFHKDCQALFAGHAPQAQAFAALATSLGEMSDPEIDSLADLLGQPIARVLKVVATAQRSAPHDSPALLLQPLQDAIWNAGVKSLLESDLNALANKR
jgi:hypothetical protein